MKYIIIPWTSEVDTLKFTITGCANNFSPESPLYIYIYIYSLDYWRIWALGLNHLYSIQQNARSIVIRKKNHI